ncbi:hypothetical protein TrST_g12614 [Triparma strigata]|uniref:Uncharacterized protein n=1 Tax=Triparma strigata TaxID=1606541 RepID=A0A9W7BY28_9STRA|nr:hypothetical protein TrST_g12614 [Triparma strigata]
MKFASAATALALTSLAHVASGTDIYLTEMPAVIPGNYTNYKYDTESGSLTTLASQLESSYTAYDMVAGSATCGNRYYAAAVQAFISWGLMVTDVETGKTQVIDHTDFPSETNDKLVQTIWCDGTDSTGNSLIAVLSDTENPTYSVYRLVVDKDMSVSTSLIADIPQGPHESNTGWSTEFQATPDGSQVYASWAVKGSSNSNGSIKRVDVESGEVSEWSVTGDNGYVYAMFPKENDAKQISAVLNYNGVSSRAFLTLNDDGSVDLGDSEEDQSLFLGGMPWQIDAEGQVGMALDNKQPQHIDFFDVDSLEVLSSLEEKDIFGDVQNRKLGGLTWGK